MDQEKGSDQFHDNELGDVYDLYNACNGALLDDGLLDIRKLYELSPAQMESLDVARLREVWEHTATGCHRCSNIIRTLNMARRMIHLERDQPYEDII